MIIVSQENNVQLGVEGVSRNSCAENLDRVRAATRRRLIAETAIPDFRNVCF